MLLASDDETRLRPVVASGYTNTWRTRRMRRGDTHTHARTRQVRSGQVRSGKTVGSGPLLLRLLVAVAVAVGW